jgi:periplasmic copper chaperone A
MTMSIALASSGLIPRARTLRGAAIAGAAAAAAVLLFAGPALAHITVSPDSVPAGSATVLTFHVPNEESKADTVKVDVQIPTDHPIAQLLVQPVPGWNVSVKTITLAKPITTDDGTFNQAVSEVIWSGGKILPGQFQSFQISADPMPSGESQVVFKAIQTYSNGDVVRWIDLQQPGQPAPDHPAPVVTLTTSTTPASTANTSAAPGATAAGADGLSRVLGVAGLVLGLLACLLALMVAMRSRRLAGAGVPAGTPAPASRAATAGEQSRDRVFAGTMASGQQDQAPAGSKTSARRTGPANTKASGRQPQGRRRG